MISVYDSGETYTNIGDGIIAATVYHVEQAHGVCWEAVVCVGLGWCLMLSLREFGGFWDTGAKKRL